MNEERHADPDNHAYGNPDGNPDRDTHGCAEPDESA